MSTDPSQTSRVFLDVSIGAEPIGRLVFELYTDETPKTCENFRQLCIGEKPPLTYKTSPFHRIIDDFMVQGGDITLGNGRGGESIYGGEFADENLNWRDLDAFGLLCMANHGKDTNSSQFFITLEECPHLNGKHTVFGHLVSGKDTLERMAKVDVDKEDRPITDVLVSHCGELARKQSPKKSRQREIAFQGTTDRDASSTERGRHKRRRTSSRSRSPSTSRGHGGRSGSRHQNRDEENRHRHRRHKRDESQSRSRTRSRTPSARDRRRSDANPDHTFRGRERRRERSGDRGYSPQPGHERKSYRKRSPPPSRPRSRDQDMRRQRSLPNQYRREDQRMDESYGRLGGGGGAGRDDQGESGVVYKGRGAMKYREKEKGGRRW